MYTVEFYGNKGWEVGKETDSWDEALNYFQDCLADKYDARITVEQNFERGTN